ncbi:MAG: hypothetical protein AAGK22_26090 [Acidobacteriota bacterium]
MFLVARIAGVLALALVCAPQAAHGQSADDAPPSVEDLLTAARETQLRDLAAWTSWSFERNVVRRRLERDGSVRSSERLDFRVSPRAGGVDELLQAIDGAKPSARQVSSHRRAARFAERHRELLGEEGKGGDDGYTLRSLLEMSEYTYGGLETRGGRPCHRLDFSPRPEEQSGVAGRVADASAGTLWISVQGAHLVEARAETTRPVGVSLGLIRVVRLAADYVGFEVDEGLWLPQRIEVYSDVRVVGGLVRKHNTFNYGGFEKPPGR